MTNSDRARELFVTGLRNAHALENQALQAMERQVDRIENYPDMAAQLRKHIQETQTQKQRLDTILQGLGESTSTIKDMAMGIMGNMAAMGHAVAEDEVLKNTFANSAIEAFEIASYKSLIAMAQAAGQQAAVAPLRASLSEEENMQRWIDQNVEKVTMTFLSLERQGASGGR